MNERSQVLLSTLPCGTVQRAREAVREGRRAFEDVMAVARATESNGDMESEVARPRVHAMSS